MPFSRGSLEFRAGAAQGGSAPRHGIVRISRVVRDLDRAESFYRTALGFCTVSRSELDAKLLLALGIVRSSANQVVMRLGREEIALVHFASPSRAYPADSRSDDLWFQHLAIVVSDMQAAYAHLCANPGWEPISCGGPQTLPAADCGVHAFKFRDPDGHPLELLWLPPGQGREDWHERRAPETTPFLGIDHCALAVSATRRSVAFYRALGMRPCNRTLNGGPAQARLDGLRAARVRVTRLCPASSQGPELELLAYRPPGRPADQPRITDAATDWMTLATLPGSPPSSAVEAPAAGAEAPSIDVEPHLLTDPDGHRIVLIGRAPALSAAPLEAR